MDNVDLRSRIVTDYLDKSDNLKITFVKPSSDICDLKHFEFVGILQANAVEEGTPMEAVFAVLAQKSIDSGANVMFPMNQGAKRVLSASSAGISLGYSHVVIGGGSERTAGAGTAGIGITKGESGYRHEPFARVAIYKFGEEEYKNCPVFPENGHDKVKSQNQILQQKVRQLQQKVRQYQQEQAQYNTCS